MKTRCLFFFLWLAAAPLGPLFSQGLTVYSSLGAEIEFSASSFTPGEILVARLHNGAAVKKVTIRFGQETFELGPPEEGLEPFALIGIDLDLRPGTHVLEAVVFGKGHQAETLRQEFSVQPRDFPVKKLRVEERFVTPPPEVRDRIAWEAELLHTLTSIITPRWLASGPFILPHDGRMAPNFGERRVYNNVPRSTHSGVDIAAPAGDPVRASNTGRVVLARELYFSGNTVILDHGLGLFTLYCHFSRIHVRRGDLVQKGDVIGFVGSTGRSTGPHLHWGARILRSRVDPLALLNLTFGD